MEEFNSLEAIDGPREDSPIARGGDDDDLDYPMVDHGSAAGADEPQQFSLDHILDMAEDFDDDQGGGGIAVDEREYTSEEISPWGHGTSGQPRRFGRVDTPLRVEPPPSFNAPARPLEQTQEQQIKASMPHAFGKLQL